MNVHAVLDEIATLPADKQEEVADFVAFLRSRIRAKDGDAPEKAAAEPTCFVGMWANRTEMSESVEWVKRLREREWGLPRA